MKRGFANTRASACKGFDKTVPDMGSASIGRGLSKKHWVNCNGGYMPTYSLYITNNVNLQKEIPMIKEAQAGPKLTTTTERNAHVNRLQRSIAIANQQSL